MQTCTIEGCGDKVFCGKMCSKHFQRWKRLGDPLAGGTYRGDPRKWIDEHKEYAGEGCLTWPFACNSKGYARVWWPRSDGKKRMKLVHVIMLENRCGSALEGHVARHLCNQGHLGCVNPSHLVWGTRSENYMDSVDNGTSSRGEKHGQSQLTEADISEIRRMLKSGMRQIDLAIEYGVSRSHISDIKFGKRWGWLTSSDQVPQLPS